MIYRLVFDTCIGTLYVEEDGRGICRAGFLQDEETSGRRRKMQEQVICRETLLLSEARKQLEEYAQGQRKMFELPLSMKGTEFQMCVWEALQTITYGETRTYGQIAATVGHPKASRAVGMANHRNPIAIIVPCHRVIGANGSLTGYAGGLDKKKLLLQLERV